MNLELSSFRTALCALGLAAGLMGCARPPSAIAENFGKAKKSIQARQIENPERSEVRDPVVGMGAATAGEVVENYHRNQKTTAQESRQQNARDSGISAVQ